MLKKVAARTLDLIGLSVFRKREDFSYGPRSLGASGHKHRDIRGLEPFGELARAVIAERTTYLYYDRLYTIYQALEQVKKLPRDPGGVLSCVEVGVFQGGTSYFIASAARSLGLESFRLHAFDTFEGHAAEDIRSDQDARHHAGRFGRTSFEAVQSYLQPLGTVSVHKGRFQDTSPVIASDAVAFAHVDVDIYEPTRFTLSFIAPRLVTGGVIVVDDYGFTTCPGAAKAVEEFLEQSPEFFALRLLTGQCVLSKWRSTPPR
jgi:hypothetical protein